MARLSPSNLKAALTSVRAARSAPLLTLAEATKELREGQIQPLQFFNQLPDDVKAEVDLLCQSESGKNFTALSLDAQRIALIEAFTEQAASLTSQAAAQHFFKIKTDPTEFTGSEKIKIDPTRFTAPAIDWLKPDEQTGVHLLDNKYLSRPLGEGFFTRVPPSTTGGGEVGARLAGTNTRQSSSRSYAPSYSSPGYGYSRRRSGSKVGVGIVFGLGGVLLGLLAAGLIWTASWALHWAFALEIGRAVTTSRGWWIGWPLGLALVGIVVGVRRDR